MTTPAKSCAVALPIHRNHATNLKDATSNATENNKNVLKPASLRELRMQLRAQLTPQLGQRQDATNPQEVALSCEIEGPYTPYCLPVSLATIRELHRLIAAYAVAYRLADETTQLLIDTAKRQSAASVPESVEWFRQQLETAGKNNTERNEHE